MSKTQPLAMTPNMQLVIQAAGHLQYGKPGLALQTCEVVLTQDAHHAEALSVAGLAHKQMGNMTQAIALMRRSVAARRPEPMHVFHLATTLAEAGRNLDALKWYERYAELQPNAEAWNNLGIILMQLGRNGEAIASLKKAVKLAKNRANMRVNYGVALQNAGRLEEAEVEMRRALELQPDLPDAILNFANVLDKTGRHNEARQCYLQLIERGANLQMALMNVANLEQRLGRYHIAEGHYRRAVEVAPNTPAMWTNWLFCLLHDEYKSPEEVYQAHRQFADHFETALLTQRKPHNNDRDPDRRIRVALVSGDLRSHSVAYFLEPLLAELAAMPSIELNAYTTTHKADDITNRMKPYFASWTEAFQLNDDELAQRIRADGIDVLIDLSGHTAGNRLLVFARKPAPVQISWMGYPGTTGLRSMDYYFGDKYFLPPTLLDDQFSEKIVQLPSSFVFQPAKDAPAVKPLPGLANGFVTFGSFSYLRKINRLVIALWAELMRKVPHSRLLMGGMPKDDSDTDVRAWFQEEGIDASRLRFIGTCPLNEYLALHNAVDIHLDPFPYNGGTTSLHAFWMGVPTLTMSGKLPSSRGGASITGHLGLPEFVADSPNEFLEKGVYWSTHLAELAQLRESMRERFQNSAVANPQMVSSGVEQAFRTMWRAWCGGQEAQSFEVRGSAPFNIPTANQTNTP